MIRVGLGRTPILTRYSSTGFLFCHSAQVIACQLGVRASYSGTFSLGTPDDGNTVEEQPFSTAERVLKLRGGFGPHDREMTASN